MIHRLSAFPSALIGCCLMASANQIFDIDIDATNIGKTYPTGGNPIVTFQCISSDFENGTARIRVSVENTNKDGKALLLFPHTVSNQTLKKNRPKVEFTKKYVGGAQALDKKLANYGVGNVKVVTENETDSIGSFTVSLGSTDTITIPFYLASYDHKKLTKAKEKNLAHPKAQVAYRISREEIYQFAIKVDGWSEHDAAYQAVKADVDKLIESLKSEKFCPNPKHTPSLTKQQEPYRNEIKRLKSVIDPILSKFKLDSKMASDPPYKAYLELRSRLDSINLKSCNKDCGHHNQKKVTATPPAPKDNTKELYHQIADTYTRLRADRITKNTAINEAKRIKNSASRCKNGKYLNKINEYYNRIINY